MNKPYKVIILISVLISAFLLWLQGSSGHLASALSAIFYGAGYFIILSLLYAGLYYCVQRERDPYGGILIFSILLTAFLFIMDYMVWDQDPPNPPAKQVIFESILIGSLYASMFFTVFSGLYYGTDKVYRLLRRSLKGSGKI